MARTGLAALTGGVQEGYEAVDAAKKRKLIRELYGHENVRLKNREKAVSDMDEDDEFDFAQFEMPETIGQRTLGWVKGLFTPEQAPAPAQAVPTAPASAPAQPFATPPAAAPRTSQAIPTYAHGGAVRTMQKKYKHGGKVEDEEKEEYTFADDLIRSGREYFGGAMPNTRRVAGQAASDIAGEARDIGEEGLSTRQRGRETREFLDEAAGGALATGAAIVEDTGIPTAYRGVRDFVGGMLSSGDEKDAAVKALPTDPTPEQDAETALPPEATTPQQAPAAAPAPAAGAPGGEERDIDFSSEARQVMPEDMPSYSVKDWEKQRRYWAAYALSQGEDPFAAMEKVDKQQLDGFSRYAMQATALIDGGDMEGATRALYAAYQYFPNGKDVRFGIQAGKDGTRQIIAMGSDEGEDGKSSGPPQILNANTISRMVENMGKPGALKTWTKDWQATEAKLWEQGFKRDELREKGRHNRAMEEVYGARTAATARRGNAPTQATLDRANVAFEKSVEMARFDDKRQAAFMSDLMSRIYSNFGGTGAGGLTYNTVINQVELAMETGDFSALDDLYGLDLGTE